MLANLISHLFYKLFLKILIRFVIFLCASNLCFYKKMRNDTYLTILKSLVSHLFSHFETPFQLVWNLLLNFSPIWSFWKLFFHFFSLSKRNELSDENFYLFSHRNFFYTFSAILKTLMRFLPASFSRSSVDHCLLESSANRFGYFDTSSRPTGVL